ncbi:MAG: tRNA preQ1(34) S-adenosylmethionine ribosyltransferase-isomerase QueA [Nitrospirae bacterium]|nr:tRNA preQ1(34) S-adenosylmethionine ribosyltransferase-isomerase QueA [Nitrospirota bacterium]MCL5421452.1 tRNA preQ1(34) S-adenosylmethionine ribosyltransferase-isomerase QueA [Nitrospirota bacterium]
MKVTDFDFYLPESLIAKRPATPRDSCRLLVLHRDGSSEHRRFFHLPEYLRKGDLLLLNNTKVFPARLTGKKQTGGRIEVFLVRETEPGVWEVLTRERYTGEIQIAEELSGEMFQGRSLKFHSGAEHAWDFRKVLWNLGSMPLPPYIKRKPEEMDKEWYQTVYASREGSIAAPTAGLHFTSELLSTLKEKGVLVRSLTLHVGTGTFKLLRVENPEEHRMDAEFFEIGSDLLETIREVKESGRRLVSVGTTTTRAIEGFLSGRYRRIETKKRGNGDRGSVLLPSVPASPRHTRICGSTDIFIYPGYQFKAVDSLITNFHLPGSTPLMLTSAFSGVRNLLDAYRSAVSMEYRFFSYGDAMLIL